MKHRTLSPIGAKTLSQAIRRSAPMADPTQTITCPPCWIARCNSSAEARSFSCTKASSRQRENTVVTSAKRPYLVNEARSPWYKKSEPGWRPPQNNVADRVTEFLRANPINGVVPAPAPIRINGAFELLGQNAGLGLIKTFSTSPFVIDVRNPDNKPPFWRRTQFSINLKMCDDANE